MPTNVIQTVTATVFSVLATNWSTVGTIHYTDPPRVYQLQQGKIVSHVYVSFEFDGKENVLLLRTIQGETLPEHRVLRPLPAAANLAPPLPISPELAFTNVGTMTLKAPQSP